MAGIMDLFRGKGADNTASPQVEQQQQNQQQQSQAAGGVTANTTVPSEATAKPDGTGVKAFPNVATDDPAKSPLSAYEKLWDIDDKNDGKEPDLTTKFTVDGSKLLEQASTIDFTKGLDPKDLEAASKGDKEALARIVNKSAQMGIAQSSAITSKIVENALNRQAEKFKNEVLPYHLKQNQISQDFSDDNPLFTSPAIAPMLNMAKQQFAKKFPKASAEEVAMQAKKYILDASEEILKANGKNVTVADDPAKKQQQKDTDWSTWL